MIIMSEEKARTLTTQDVYDILNFSVQAAEDDGFMNAFVFSRSLYCFAALFLYQDRAEELRPVIAENINSAFDYLLDDGTIEKMANDFPHDLEFLANAGNEWFTDYREYSQSARGLLNTLQVFTGDIVNAAVESFKNAAEESGVTEALAIADKWGMNNEATKSEGNNEESSAEALF